MVMDIKPAETRPSFNPDCKRCVALDLDRCEDLDNDNTNPPESPCIVCGHVKGSVSA